MGGGGGESGKDVCMVSKNSKTHALEILFLSQRKFIFGRNPSKFIYIEDSIKQLNLRKKSDSITC